MTQQATAAHEQPEPVEQRPTHPAHLAHVDPRTLTVDANVRDTVTLDKHFIASLRALGVLTPIGARRLPDGELRVILGGRIEA